MPMPPPDALQPLERLLAIASRDTHQSRRVADFLLAWFNAAENGGWDPVDLWDVDGQIADDMLAVLHLIKAHHYYPDGLGYEEQIQAIWKRWRGPAGAAESQPPPDLGDRGFAGNAQQLLRPTED